MLIFTMAGLIVLFAIGILYAQYNALNFAYLASKIQNTYLDKIALGLLLAALAMKIGAAPMHLWVPDAYAEAPSSATIVLICNSQACLYGLLRICFSLYGLKLNAVSVGWIVVILGVLSIFVGVTVALIQRDMNRLIAYAAVSQTGYMLLGLGTGLVALRSGAAYGITALQGGIFHIINDIATMGLLFLTAGAIYYAVCKRDLNDIGGLAWDMKYTAILFLIGALAIAGVPPLNGFASKLMIYESVYRLNPLLAVIAVLSSIVLLATFTKVFYSAFLGARVVKAKEAPKSMLFAMSVLALIVIAFGMFPSFIVKQLIAPAAEALRNCGAYIGGIGL
jgi:multicomponent Na+:H+ antiporter subunit D